jgi:hypothetical protein
MLLLVQPACALFARATASGQLPGIWRAQALLVQVVPAGGYANQVGAYWQLKSREGLQQATN